MTFAQDQNAIAHPEDLWQRLDAALKA